MFEYCSVGKNRFHFSPFLPNLSSPRGLCGSAILSIHQKVGWSKCDFSWKVCSFQVFNIALVLIVLERWILSCADGNEQLYVARMTFVWYSWGNLRWWQKTCELPENFTLPHLHHQLRPRETGTLRSLEGVYAPLYWLSVIEAWQWAWWDDQRSQSVLI